MRIVTDVRVDTLPSRLIWSHRSHPVEDTLRGTWQLLDPLPPFGPEEEDATYLSVIRALMHQGVIRSNESAGHCLLPVSGARFARPLGPQEFEFDAGRVPEDLDSYHVYLLRVD